MAIPCGFDRFGPTRICRRMCKDRAAVRAAIDRMLAEDFDRVIVSHGRVLPTGGHEAVRAGFAALLGTQPDITVVATAANGEEAVRAHAAESFDLILMDVQMPEMNGLEATAHIRDREKITGEHVPIIALTAHAIQGDRERCLESGMDDYLSKPLSASTLKEKVDRIARNKQPSEVGCA